MVASGDILSNRYLLRGEVGAGGMGMVYDATDLRTGGQVAVKILHPYYAADPQYISRLRREAQIAASIRSPRVVKVTDLGEDGPVHYLVMEFVAGETLSQKIKRQGRLECDEALHYCIEIARALTAAHAVGVLHRDLKPDNVKITEEGEVKVLDFGIARAQDQPGITGTNVFAGTPEYCAPERADGEADIRSDIYSIGVILYELIAGHPPFTAATPFAVLRRHESAPVPQLPVPVPDAIQEVLDRSLAKRREERYQTPADLLAALRSAQESVLGERVGGGRLAATLADEDRPRRIATVAAPRTVAQSTGLLTEGAVERKRSGGGRGVLLGGIAALALLGGSIAAFALTRGDDNGGEPTPTATQSAGGVTPAPTSAPTTRPTTAPVQVLLKPGEKIDLGAAHERLLPACLDSQNRPRIAEILRVDSIERSADGRQTTVTYTITVPRVQNVECPLQYQGDAGVRQVFLETRQGDRSLRTESNGGRGFTENGSGGRVIYGLTGVPGEWTFDGVPLEGNQLTLIVLSRVTGEEGGELHKIPLLPKP